VGLWPGSTKILPKEPSYASLIADHEIEQTAPTYKLKSLQYCGSAAAQRSKNGWLSIEILASDM